MTEHFPPPTVRPCNECPWRRKALRGHLGPNTAEEWAEMAHGEVAVACHKTIKGDVPWDDPDIRQCAGLAIMRRNMFKTPRHPGIALADEPDHEAVFSWTDEFVRHHTS